MDPVSEIGLDEYMNCVLVQSDVRPAFLIQPVDYREINNSYPKTKRKLDAIKLTFPDLIISIIKGEALISKRAYTEEDFKKNQDMGEALGYPCADEYEYTLMHKNEPDVAIYVTATMTDGTSLQLLANACKDDSKVAQFEALAVAAERVLKADPLLTGKLASVVVKKNVTIPVKYILQKLIRNEALNEDEEFNLRNQIWNMGWEDGNAMSDYKYEFNNPVHRGILMTLMTYVKEDPMEPFYPLHNRQEWIGVVTRMRRWSRELRRVLNESKLWVAGGRRRRTRRNQRK
jgi:hypothetical protein